MKTFCNHGLSFLAGILFCWFIIQPAVYKLTHPLAPKSYKDVVITKVVTSTDTVYIPRFSQKTLVLTIPVAKVVDSTIIDTVRIDAWAKKRYAANFTRKIYEDTVDVEKDVQVGYKADVTGILNGMELSYKDSRPQMIIKDSTTITNTILRQQRSLYLGVEGTNTLRYVGPQLQYLDRRGNAFGIGVNALSLPTNPEVKLSFSKKLF
jgi:hypothetical protein